MRSAFFAITLSCVVFTGFLALAPSVVADEIDDILTIERDVVAAPAASSTPKASTSKPASDGSADTIRLQQELQETKRALWAAQEEVAGLKSLLKHQEMRHHTELLYAHYNMGCVYKASRQYARAEAEFLKALSISPDDTAVHYNLGILYDDDLEQPEKARRHYQRFLELAPDDKDASSVQEWLAKLDE